MAPPAVVPAATLAAIMIGVVGTIASVVPNLADIIKSVEFQGFDPKVLYAALLQKEPDEKILLVDMITILGVVVTRGTRLAKAIKRMPEAGRRIIAPLLNKYGIRDATPQKPTDITVARLIACFPAIMAEILSLGYGEVIGVVPMGFPKWLCFPAAPALFPVGAKGDPWMKSWRVWNKSFSDIIKAPDTTIDYGEICHSSSVLSDLERLRLVAKIKTNATVHGTGANNVIDIRVDEWIKEHIGYVPIP